VKPLCLPMTIPCHKALLTDLPPTIFDEAFRAVTERLDTYVGATVLELAGRLALPSGRPLTARALLTERGWVRDGEVALTWLLETLTLFGHAESDSDGTRLKAGPPPLSAAEIRRQAEALAPATAPAYALLALAAAELPAVLRGEKRGEDVLFGPATMSLWFEYVSNSNPHYSPNNAITAAAASTCVPPRATILEIGGGGGGAGEAILGALTREGLAPACYVFTDVHPAFIRRGSRLVQQCAPPDCEVRSQRFDMNLALDGQGLEPAAYDAIVAVNVLHLARDIVASLSHLRSLLRPGGVLFIGELIRPVHGTVHLELPFTLLEAYREVTLDPVMRPRPGFIAAQGWQTALARAGFGEVRLVPANLERCAEDYPGFYCGTFLAKR
jgi:SAM-dependent methyltransferase